MAAGRLVLGVGVAIAMCLTASGTGSAARKPAGKLITKVTTVVETVPAAKGQVDWTKGEISAKGVGVRPKGTDPAQGRAMAREAAIVVAERNLVKIVHGIHINSETTVRNAVLENDEIQRRVEGFIRGATVRSERELEDGSYEVVMALPMYGADDSLAAAIGLGGRATGRTDSESLEDKDEREQDEALSRPAAEKPSASREEARRKPFTGLVIDCRGIGIQRSMCPKILDESGQEVWGTMNVDPDLVNEKGIAGYYRSVDQAKSMGRVGKNPLVVKAIGKGGPKAFPSDPIVKQADAARIVAEDATGGFLNRLAVGFVVD